MGRSRTRRSDCLVAWRGSAPPSGCTKRRVRGGRVSANGRSVGRNSRHCSAKSGNPHERNRVLSGRFLPMQAALRRRLEPLHTREVAGSKPAAPTTAASRARRTRGQRQRRGGPVATARGRRPPRRSTRRGRSGGSRPGPTPAAPGGSGAGAPARARAGTPCAGPCPRRTLEGPPASRIRDGRSRTASPEASSAPVRSAARARPTRASFARAGAPTPASRRRRAGGRSAARGAAGRRRAGASAGASRRACRRRPGSTRRGG